MMVICRPPQPWAGTLPTEYATPAHANQKLGIGRSTPAAAQLLTVAILTKRNLETSLPPTAAKNTKRQKVPYDPYMPYAPYTPYDSYSPYNPYDPYDPRFMLDTNRSHQRMTDMTHMTHAVFEVSYLSFTPRAPKSAWNADDLSSGRRPHDTYDGYGDKINVTYNP
jgi:hypothetical protein